MGEAIEQLLIIKTVPVVTDRLPGPTLHKLANEVLRNKGTNVQSRACTGQQLPLPRILPVIGEMLHFCNVGVTLGVHSYLSMLH